MKNNMNQDLIWALEAAFKQKTIKAETLIDAYKQNPETTKIIDKENE
jgi:hypothetical protein